MLAGIGGATAAQATPAALANDATAIEGSAPDWATPSAKVGEVDGGEVRQIQVALSLKDPRGAEALARAVTTPGSPAHGRFLSSAQFVDRFAADPATVDRVAKWLRGQGLKVTGVSANRHFITAEAAVSTLQAAFKVRLSKYQHTSKRGALVLTAPDQAVSVPRHLRGSVQAVLGLDDSELTIAPKQVAMRSPQGTRVGVAPAAPGDAQSCARYWGEANNTGVPQRFAAGNQSNVLCGYNTAQMRSIYGLNSANSGSGSTVAIVGAYNHTAIVGDTNRAAASFGSPQLAAGQYSAVLPPSYDNQDRCAPESWAGEQALDVQAIHTIAPAAKIVYYGASSCYTLLDALNKAVQENKASVISNSWGYAGESAVPAANRQQMDSIALQAAIQGQAITVSSGDAGDNSGGSSIGKVEADFPASHPWVTAVGGTSVALGADNKVRFQAGWEISGFTQSGTNWTAQADADGRFAGGAGGGRSLLFDQPDYQKGVVPDGIAAGKRATPDISALADAYTGFAVGYTDSGHGYVEYASGGTSAAAPIVAALVANAQQSQGVARMGFLNAAIYQLAGKAAVTDVKPVAAGVWSPYMVGYGKVTVPTTQGSYLAAFDSKPQSLQSAPGWDTVTGVGTPNAGFLTALGK
ncbi:1301aa long hypothetical pseudomonapepsin [Alloactinosynnema sp. L-07]|uniref:S53 family peptidase n=1 Tax=Alloactinosynnema sp. L-07 TaxID=1653480 RepID=UPI00065EFCA2|nr:S53 family serine peptidase [Alloactinosynnema sp. L-07]CRK57009.1 1301aa long hypothetical pseudomonapepsin [Alloactinosynnema sp. L-07]